jgi:predicted unusual protein kinase regulating ubiquinone biosynthesis (AarF/ABC1/UbiB family)
MTAEDDAPVAGLRRRVRLGTAAGGFALRGLGERLGFGGDRSKHAVEMRRILGELRGPVVKAAQLLAALPDVLPEEYARELAGLQTNAPPMGPAFVKRRMSGELGDDWRGKFDWFDDKSSFAASLGQVHRARTHDGMDVACKLQYPGMREAIDGDIKQLKGFLSLYERWDPSLKTTQVLEELKDRLAEELDYDRERRHMALFADILEDEDTVHVPTPVAELSTDRLLTSQWLEGAHILSMEDAPQEERDAVAKALFRAWYFPLYRYGVIHGDPHFGNYTVREDRTINLLDFGCARIFPGAFIEGVIELYHALMADDRERAVHAFGLWGFKDLSKDMVDALMTWARFVYAPLIEDKTQPIAPENQTERGRKMLAGVRQELRKAGGVELPREFVFIDRSAVGLGSLFLRLKANVNWHRVFAQLITDFDREDLDRRQGKLLDRYDLEVGG